MWGVGKAVIASLQLSTRKLQQGVAIQRMKFSNYDVISSGTCKNFRQYFDELPFNLPSVEMPLHTILLQKLYLPANVYLQPDYQSDLRICTNYGMNIK
ncbi:hypothetical protein V7S43_018998 [Phytophthora oleae]|uniref:Uncharacterized protein n=1 Tax=Phytophthora oleae TaxID=2107226 RepID=A0ABD3EP32_9STRA